MDTGSKIGIRFQEMFVNHHFQYLQEYYDELGPIIKSEKEQLIKKMEQLNKESTEIQEEYGDTYADDWFSIENIVEKNFCNSIIISIYILIEKHLNGLCKELKDYQNIPINYCDLRGQGVERARKYIEKLIGLKISDSDANFLRGINALRNAIAHANGELYDVDDKTISKIKEFAKQVPGCNIITDKTYFDKNGKVVDLDKEVEIKLECVEHCLKYAKNIFKNLFLQL
jgi:hypothetical protein